MVVALAVGVVGEDLAERVEINVVGIAEAVREDFAGLAVGRDADERAGVDLLDGGTGELRVFAADAGVIAADEVEPTVRAFHDAVGRVLAVALGAEPELGFAIGSTVAVRVAPAADATVAVHDEVVAVEIHSVRTGLAGLHEECGLVGLPVAVGVVEDFHILLTSHDDAALGVGGHGVDVMREVVAGVERDFKAIRHAEAVAHGGGAGKREGDEQQQEGKAAMHGEQTSVGA